ncbi:MFS transporter [Kitasatospora sp. NA04385]|uniref:MDR family MFS transporter n=1 Tax=Kitasatospora sp. NA04385 TaxID=2742135 RepID=UPI00158FF2CE|nr:MDR family MFS transporter [Kitasatospora sp. NA04385]QKW21677.1 MFS transporter [Kitasatospora sp. NA04385]
MAVARSTAPEPAGSPTAGARPSRRMIWALVGVVVTSFLSALDQTVTAVSVFPIARDLDPVNGVSLMSWVIGAYMLGSTATQPLYGRIADIFGAKRVFLFSAVGFLVASGLCGVAQSMGQLIAFRALQGIGAGGLYSVSLILMARSVAPKDRAKFQGIAGIVILLATIAGPLIGGFLTGDHTVFGLHTSWRWIFYVNLPIGAVGITMVVTLLKLPHEQRSHRVDYLGALLASAGTALLLLMTTWGGTEYPWSDPLIWVLGAGGAALLGLFLWRQAKAPEPLVPLSLFRVRTVAVSGPMLFVVGFAMMGAITYVALYLQLVNGLNPTQTGLRMMPMILGILVSSIGSGIVISARDGRYRIFPIIGAAVSAAGLGVLGLLSAGSSYWLLAGGLLLLGAGLGLLMQVLVQAVQNSVPNAELGSATTSAIFLRTLGQSCGAAVFGAILANRFDARVALHPELPAGLKPEGLAHLAGSARDAAVDAFTGSLDVVFLVAAAVMLVAFLLSFLLKEMQLREIDDFEALASELGDESLAGGAAVAGSPAAAGSTTAAGGAAVAGPRGPEDDSAPSTLR